MTGRELLEKLRAMPEYQLDVEIVVSAASDEYNIDSLEIVELIRREDCLLELQIIY